MLDMNDVENETMHLEKEEDEPEDTSTDADSLRFLQQAGLPMKVLPHNQLQRAARTALPAPTYDEKLVLAEDFDQKQLDERYKHDAARFSGGEAKKLGKSPFRRLFISC